MYLYGFWLKENWVDFKQDYDKYMEVVRVVDNMYNFGFCYGFEIDRGYVYMKYGQLSDIFCNENEFFVLLYEIWLYNQMLRMN